MFDIYKKSLALADKLPEFRLIRLSAHIRTPATNPMAADPLGCHAKAKTVAAINCTTNPIRSH